MSELNCGVAYESTAEKEPVLVVNIKPDGRLQRRLRTRRVHRERERSTIAVANRARVLRRKVRRAKHLGLPHGRLSGVVDSLNERANRLSSRFHVTISARAASHSNGEE
ncbi:MAG: hypothetical protein ABIG34_00665 [Candidatus Peregrinibacteria bacterium]